MSTLSNSELGTSDFQSRPAERGTADLAPETRNPEVTLRDRAWEILGRAKSYWAVPSWVREPPATLLELTAYAREGAWTKRYVGFIRRLGILWLYVVAIPATTVAYLKAHVLQRPGRTVAAALLWLIFSRSVPGIWVADHIIRPYFQALAWIFLP